MLRILLTDRVAAKIPADFHFARLFTARKLSQAESLYLRRSGIKRFYLPTLSSEDVILFFAAFDRFWDTLIRDFGRDHVFWRNAVSSKMQEWESSAGYLAVVLFALTKAPDPRTSLWIITDSLEEEDLIKAWGKKQGWTIVEPFRQPRWLRRGIQEAKNFIRYLYLVYTVFRRKIFSAESKNSHSMPEKNSVLLASMFYPSSFKEGQYKDPFFGNLHEFLSNKGKHVAYLSDSIPLPDASIHMSVKECQNVILKMPLILLNWVEWAGVLIRLFCRRIKFPPAPFMDCDFSGFLDWQARSFKFHFNWHAEVYYEAVKKICRRHVFEELIFNFEGNVFERGCLQAVEGSSTWTCGYSQGVIYPENLKLRLSSWEGRLRPEPQRIVCTGPQAREFFSRVGNRENRWLAPGCTLREIPPFSANCRWDPKIILVALDGVYNTVTVLDWLLEQQDFLKDYHVRLRGHPNVPLAEIQKQCLGEFPSNFVMSDRTLQEDILESGCVFYRHTSIGLQALVNGKPVVHLSIDCPLPGDPLEDITLGKWGVHSPQELKEVLNRIGRLTPDERASLKDVRRWLEGYFTPPREETMGDFLPEKRMEVCLNRS